MSADYPFRLIDHGREAPLPDPGNIFSSDIKVYTTRIRIESPIAGLRPGMTAQVKILVDHPSVTEGDARKVLYENAAQVFGFDLASLEAHIGRVGFSLQDIPEPERDKMQMSSLFEVATSSRLTPD